MRWTKHQAQVFGIYNKDRNKVQTYIIVIHNTYLIILNLKINFGLNSISWVGANQFDGHQIEAIATILIINYGPNAEFQSIFNTIGGSKPYGGHHIEAISTILSLVLMCFLNISEEMLS
jgi:hypothetical protein